MNLPTVNGIDLYLKFAHWINFCSWNLPTMMLLWLVKLLFPLLVVLLSLVGCIAPEWCYCDLEFWTLSIFYFFFRINFLVMYRTKPYNTDISVYRSSIYQKFWYGNSNDFWHTEFLIRYTVHPVWYSIVPKSPLKRIQTFGLSFRLKIHHSNNKVFLKKIHRKYT